MFEITVDCEKTCIFTLGTGIWLEGDSIEFCDGFQPILEVFDYGLVTGGLIKGNEWMNVTDVGVGQGSLFVKKKLRKLRQLMTNYWRIFNYYIKKNYKSQKNI